MIYTAPSTFDELQQALSDHSDVECGVLAGGTDLMPRWEMDKGLKPDVLVDLKKMDELVGIRENEDEIIIGALTTVQDIKKSSLIYNQFKALYEAAEQFAGVQIRNRATIGGNICNASPAGDLLPGLYAHKADIEVIGSNSSRTVPISDFIVGPGKTVMEPGEILSEIHLSKKGEGSLFYKLGLRQSMAIAVVNFAIAHQQDSNGTIISLIVAAGSVAPTIVFLESFSDSIISGVPLDEAIETVDIDISPIDDIRATADYRRTALKNVLKYTIASLSV